jgi:hypothetical protein
VAKGIDYSSRVKLILLKAGAGIPKMGCAGPKCENELAVILLKFLRVSEVD